MAYKKAEAAEGEKTVDLSAEVLAEVDKRIAGMLAAAEEKANRIIAEAEKRALKEPFPWL